MSYLENYHQLAKDFKTQQQMAEALNCSQPSVWKWLNGKGYMSAYTALRAERITNGKFKAVDLCPALKEVATA